MINLIKFNMTVFYNRLIKHQLRGQTLVEYGLIVLLIAVAIILVLGLLGGQVQAIWQTIVDAFTG